MERLRLAKEQKQFFATFGYLALPGLVADVIDEITAAFEQVWRERGHVHEGEQRSMIVPFIDQHERLCRLLDDPRIEGLVGSLLGDDFNYLGSDGNFYVGDTQWHSDRWTTELRWVKVAFYLDAVGRDTGCLRVIPGSHRLQESYAQKVQEEIGASAEMWGVEGAGVPALALESEPGDVVVFNHNLKHAAFGGGTRRRMFTINCCERGVGMQIEAVKEAISIHAKYDIEQMYSQTMVQTAGPERMVHLEQVLAHQGHMPEERAKWRAEQAARQN